MADKNVRHLRPLDGGGEPPDMEQRLRSLEQEVHVIRETMATREDLHKELNAQTWKMVTALIASMAVMTALFTAIVKWV
ncbi:hypothetical protein [Halomonas cerina]|uniref:Uncharacterized protein n=1 Tax=Halomonas cerina TaxID=447424 RepID=A0A839V5F0_9GAMM|nr:hypothetical protein [Halomonas cerina]MBB3189218.1 hypothetical protein [Halomonas cerina]